jgi:hypothetical protein
MSTPLRRAREAARAPDLNGAPGTPTSKTVKSPRVASEAARVHMFAGGGH